MSKRRSGNHRQSEPITQTMRPVVPIQENHQLVLLTEKMNWAELEEHVQQIRMSKLKSNAGRPPHLRELMGAMIFKGMRDVTWREAEDQIRHYAPARYLCGLTESEWTPDYTTMHGFAVLLGEDGMKMLNEYAVKWAVNEKLADPSVIVADTTAQEANVPYPNEMGLMASFMVSLAAASKKAGKIFKEFAAKVEGKFKVAKEKVREYRLFAKTKEDKDRMVEEMATLTEQVQKELSSALKRAKAAPQKLAKYGLVARAKVEKLHETMKELVPQIRYWLKTGWVAADKIISIHIPEVYSIVRGKSGKAVEFGLKWGLTRLRGGFLLASLATSKKDGADTKFAVKAVEEHISLFGAPPRAYAFDRGGYSEKNVDTLKKLGVKEVGLAPRGRAAWAVSDSTKEKLVQERALIEAGIGTIKSRRYGFNRPRARSKRMMGASGQLSVFGFNLNKLIRGLASRDRIELTG